MQERGFGFSVKPVYVLLELSYIMRDGSACSHVTEKNPIAKDGEPAEYEVFCFSSHMKKSPCNRKCA